MIPSHDGVPESSFELKGNDKFCLFAYENALLAIPSGTVLHLPPQTWALESLPFRLEGEWREWLGSITIEALDESRFLLISKIPSSVPEILDAEHDQLFKQLNVLHYMLQLSGVVAGKVRVLNGGRGLQGPVVRQLTGTDEFTIMNGTAPAPITAEIVRTAADRASTFRRFRQTGGYERFLRALNVLWTTLKNPFPQEREHGFVRSMEGLILPDKGATTKQFVHRCLTFVITNAAAREILTQAYDMRSDTEHLHHWHRALNGYAEVKRERMALLRTWQMERLARFAYSRILDEPTLHPRFQSKTTMDEFWRLRDDERRGIWGLPLDLESLEAELGENTE